MNAAKKRILKTQSKWADAKVEVRSIPQPKGAVHVVHEYRGGSGESVVRSLYIKIQEYQLHPSKDGLQYMRQFGQEHTQNEESP